MSISRNRLIQIKRPVCARRQAEPADSISVVEDGSWTTARAAFQSATQRPAVSLMMIKTAKSRRDVMGALLGRPQLAFDAVSRHPLGCSNHAWEVGLMVDSNEFARELSALIKRYIDGGCDPQTVADELTREANYVFGHYNLEIYFEKISNN